MTTKILIGETEEFIIDEEQLPEIVKHLDELKAVRQITNNVKEVVTNNFGGKELING